MQQITPNPYRHFNKTQIRQVLGSLKVLRANLARPGGFAASEGICIFVPAMIVRTLLVDWSGVEGYSGSPIFPISDPCHEISPDPVVNSWRADMAYQEAKHNDSMFSTGTAYGRRRIAVTHWLYAAAVQRLQQLNSK